MGMRVCEGLAMPLLEAFPAGETLLCMVSCVWPHWKMGLALPSWAGWRNPQTVQGLTERDWLIDLEAAEDPVHIAGVSEAVPSHDYLEWFWNE